MLGGLFLFAMLAIYTFACVVLIFVILIQSGKGGGLSSLGSASQGLTEALGATGAEKTLNKLTTWCAVGFMVLALLISLVAPHVMGKTSRGLIGNNGAPANTPVSQQAPVAGGAPAAPGAQTVPGAAVAPGAAQKAPSTPMNRVPAAPGAAQRVPPVGQPRVKAIVPGSQPAAPVPGQPSVKVVTPGGQPAAPSASPAKPGTPAAQPR